MLDLETLKVYFEDMNWVLIRGLVSEEFHWGDFVPLMKKHFKNDSIFTADIIGNGKSHKEKTPLTVSKNIEGLRRQVPAKGPKILIGFSLGGMLALEWAYAHPEEVVGVVLINTSLNSSRFYQRFQLPALAQFFRAGHPKNNSVKEQMILKLITGLPQKEILPLAKKWRARSAMYPISMENFFRQFLIGAKIKQRINPPKVPILMLASEKDKIVHPDCSRRIAEAWELPLRIHRKAGHDVAVDDPDWILQHLDSWLKDNKGKKKFPPVKTQRPQPRPKKA